MRLIPLSAAVLILASGVASAGPVGQDIRYISSEKAEVRSGRSIATEFYVTNRPKKGTPIEVMMEHPGGWLEIRPPEGSFSYINTRFLKHLFPDQPNHVVILEGEQVPVFIGSEVENKRPTVVGVRLLPGTQVISKGKPVFDEAGSWMPIVPPDRERRYILASSVTKTPLSPGAIAQLGGTAHSTFTPTSGTLPPSMAPSANPGGNPEQMSQQAYQAERAGQIQEAIRLYAQLGANTVNSNPRLSTWALQRASFLQSGYRAYGQSAGVAQPVTMVPAVGVSATPVSRASSAVSVGAPAPQGGIPAYPSGAMAQSSTFLPTAPTGTPPRVSNAVWQGYRGVLRRSGRSSGGVQTYVIDDPNTLRPLVEVMPARGMNLDAYLMRNVQVHGYTWYRGDLRRNFMNASQLIPEL